MDVDFSALERIWGKVSEHVLGWLAVILIITMIPLLTGIHSKAELLEMKITLLGVTFPYWNIPIGVMFIWIYVFMRCKLFAFRRLEKTQADIVNAEARLKEIEEKHASMNREYEHIVRELEAMKRAVEQKSMSEFVEALKRGQTRYSKD